VTRCSRHRKPRPAAAVAISALQVVLAELHECRLRSIIESKCRAVARVKTHIVASTPTASLSARLHSASPADQVVVTHIVGVGDADGVAKREVGVARSRTRSRWANGTAENMLAAEVGSGGKSSEVDCEAPARPARVAAVRNEACDGASLPDVLVVVPSVHGVDDFSGITHATLVGHPTITPNTPKAAQAGFGRTSQYKDSGSSK